MDKDIDYANPDFSIKMIQLEEEDLEKELEKAHTVEENEKIKKRLEELREKENTIIDYMWEEADCLYK